MAKKKRKSKGANIPPSVVKIGKYFLAFSVICACPPIMLIAVFYGIFKIIFWIARIPKRRAERARIIMNENIAEKMSMMSGIEFEDFIAELMIEDGFHDVRTTRASGDYGADVIGKDDDDTLCVVQCKKYSGTVGISAIQEVIGARAYYRADRAIVATNSRFTKAATDLAFKAEVELWDGDKIIDMVDVTNEDGYYQDDIDELEIYDIIDGEDE